ncbi:MAG: glycosyltransferase [Planctomycetes bacterium]|nr:glycosyltransferase [Planctomycetota bacterium]
MRFKRRGATPAPQFARNRPPRVQIRSLRSLHDLEHSSAESLWVSSVLALDLDGSIEEREVRTPMVRISFVVNGFVVGGIQRSVARIVNGLDVSRFECSIISLTDDLSAAGWITNPTVRVVTLGKRAGNDIGVAVRLARVLRTLRPRIVQSHNWGTLVETVCARRIAGVPVHIHAERGTVGAHNWSPGWRTSIRRIVMRLALETVDVAMTNAESVAKRLCECCGYLQSRMIVIPNGLDVRTSNGDHAERSKTRRTIGARDDDIVVGSIGRLDPVKGFDMAVDAVRMLRAHRSDVHFVVIGDGPMREQLSAKVREAECASYVHLVGHHDDVETWLRAMDVYVNTSISEGMSQSILEAMAIGLPMIVTDVGDNARLVGGPEPCGLVVPPNCKGVLAWAMNWVAASVRVREELGRSALRRYRENYTASRMLERFSHLYGGLEAGIASGPCQQH